MHSSPQYPSNYNDASQDGNLLFGTEYATTGALDWNTNGDAACAVCQRGQATQSYVQWGRRTCSNGHRTEYTGYVMGEKTAHARRESLCIDTRRMAHATSTSTNDGGALLFLAEMEGSAGNREAFPNYREVACAMCTTEAAVYPRWGALACSDEAERLYEGFIALGRWNDRGSNAKALCLHVTNPEYPLGYDDRDQVGSSLYGAEYYPTGGPFDRNIFGDAACVMCSHGGYAKPYVQWGRTQCSNGHLTEYSGVVMGSLDSSSAYRSEHLCVDAVRGVHSRSVPQTEYPRFCPSVHDRDRTRPPG